MIIEPVRNIARSLCCGHEAREVGRDAERAAVDLGQAEGRVVGGDDDVGVAGEADAAAEAEALHRRDHGHLAVVHRAERLVAAPVDPHERSRGSGRRRAP